MSKEKSWQDTLRHGKQEIPPRLVIYGGHGIGKSTLASQFPAPIFISTEDGLDSLDVTSFPRAANINEVVESIKTLIKEDHAIRLAPYRLRELPSLFVTNVPWRRAN